MAKKPEKIIPKKLLKKGYNLFSALTKIQEPIDNETIYRALSSKPGKEKY